jgi:hypothetical protein
VQKACGMKKIIILSDTDNPRFGLVSQLKEMFPECEIQIIHRHPESIEEDMLTESTVISFNKSGETVI